jgi:diaminohydroxyphosphoribosylaminopyrimidine deaminase/5-amino-6-(5-phosphoribosylamino)uracil reductase
MRRALALAAYGWGRVAPNPMVGAVVVKDGAVVGEGWHAEYGGPHAEAVALERAGERARGSTVYVSLEPCSHQGKTPPCTLALMRAGVARVVFAASDPNPRAGGGAAALRGAGVEVEEGVEEDAARELNAVFFHLHSPEGAARPWVALKLAVSLDGRVADLQGRSAWITGREAREEVHRLRAGSDAVAVGIGTVLSDDPLLTVRGGVEPRRPPTRVVFDRRLRLPLDSRLVATANEAPVWVLCAPDAPEVTRRRLQAAGVRVLAAEGLEGALATLRAEGVTSLFCEGGARLGSALLAEDRVDRMHLFYAPLLLGPEAISPFSGVVSPDLAQAHRWRRIDTRTFGADILVTVAR